MRCKKLGEKQNKEIKEPPTVETPSRREKRFERRFSGESVKENPKFNEGKTGLREARGKKQRRQFKLDPNRG